MLWDYTRNYPVQYLENIGIEQSDWLILVIGPLTTLVM